MPDSTVNYQRIAMTDLDSISMDYLKAKSIIRLVMERLGCMPDEEAGLLVALEILERASTDLDSALQPV